MSRRAPAPGRPTLLGGSACFDMGEDHPAGRCLEDTGDGYVYLVADVAAPAIDPDHCPVVQERDTLAELLTLLDDAILHLLAGEHHGLEGVG